MSVIYSVRKPVRSTFKFKISVFFLKTYFYLLLPPCATPSEPGTAEAYDADYYYLLLTT